jgi:Undecaprenyl-phosphate glucose phosphotransferase
MAKSVLLFAAFCIFYLVTTGNFMSNYLEVFYSFGAIILYFFICRLIFFLYRKKYKIKLGRKIYPANTVIVGSCRFSELTVKNKSLRRSFGIRGLYAQESLSRRERYLGDLNQLLIDLSQSNISAVIFCNSNLEFELFKKIVDICEQNLIRLYMIPEFKYITQTPNNIELIHGIPLIRLLQEPLSDRRKQLLKRLFDISFSAVIIIFILSWLIPLLALVIKLESNDSVFFVQIRSGHNNNIFKCLKFRSMTRNNNADEKTAIKNDPRVTKIGAFMRKTSIDELPQFINVFLGQMSVVGPRPHMVSQTQLYSKVVKKYMTRHMVKPGITGWAQVMGSRGEIFSDKDMERRVEKDIWYIQNWSFFLDLKIIFLTLYNIFKGDKQAY